ncbi:MAG: hypothetical protein HC908_02470 [Calothrix sp. SM1_7_51]|nr:hypothetical protein [Calothrix sp. SM1_7_51]
METQLQQSEYIDASTTSSESMTALEVNSQPQENLPMLPPATSNSQLSEFKVKTSLFFERLPENIETFFNRYQQPIIVIGAFLAAVVALRVVLAVLYAINSLPLVSPLLEMVGIGYTTWFIFRYLLKAETRQELGRDFGYFKKEILGEANNG